MTGFVLQYNIKKKEEVQEIQQEEPNPLMRKKKTPEELAREAEAEDEDEFTSQSQLSSFLFTLAPLRSPPTLCNTHISYL